MDALTDRRYWDAVWSYTSGKASGTPNTTSVASEVPEVRVPADFQQTILHRLFAAHLRPGSRFLEIGAGGSAWPAEVANAFGAEAWGIDFSETGLAMAEAAAARAGKPVHLVAGDFFDRTLLPAAAFDVVYSGGFVEHFSDATPMQRACELLRPGGLVVTTVPNLVGLNGVLQRVVDQDCFERHVRFTPAELDRRHREAGLMVMIPASYMGALDLGSVNFYELAMRLPKVVLQGIWFFLSTTRRIAEQAMRVAGKSSSGRIFAPTLFGVYARPR